MSRYLDLYPNSLNGTGLISQITALPRCPWSSISVSQAQSVEILYALRSGTKPLVSIFPKIAPENRAPFVLEMFLDKWQKYWDAFKVQYSITEPYSVTETGSEERQFDRNDVNTFGRIVDTTGSDTGTVQNAGQSTNNNQNGIFGFNSIDAVPSDTSNGTDTSTDTQTRNLSATGRSTNSGSDSLDRSDTDNLEYSRTKSGNLGYQSPQDLLMAEFELWKEPFFEYVFRDIDHLIALAIY